MSFNLPRAYHSRAFVSTSLKFCKEHMGFSRNVSRNLTTQSGGSSNNEQIRQMIVHEIGRNPSLLSSGMVTINTRRPNWRRKVVTIAASCGLFSGIYFAHQYYQVYSQDDEESEPRIVFLPFWIGFNYPKQRHLAFPAYIQYFDPELFEASDAHSIEDMVGRDNIERRVLDCLFRSLIIRETFKFPISVKSNPEDIFDVWIEPHHCTIHGPQFSIFKAEGKISVDYTWAINSIKWGDELSDIVSGLSSEFDSLTTTEAQKNTHDRSSGRIHEANSGVESNSSERSSVKNQDYNIAFKGTLNVADLKQQHTGSVAYTGVIDNAHLGLSGGVRILTLTLEVSEYGKSNTLYKLK